MIRFLSVFLALTFVASPVLAADDGGFGSDRFYEEAPAALNDPDAFDPQAIEPAAGVEADADAQIEDEAGVTGEPSNDNTPSAAQVRDTIIDMEPAAE